MNPFWPITATCFACGFTHKCWFDGRGWLCHDCFNNEHGFDPRMCEWEHEAAAA